MRLGDRLRWLLPKKSILSIAAPRDAARRFYPSSDDLEPTTLLDLSEAFYLFFQDYRTSPIYG